MIFGGSLVIIAYLLARQFKSPTTDEYLGSLRAEIEDSEAVLRAYASKVASGSISRMPSSVAFPGPELADDKPAVLYTG
jgi:hypothetical protein